MKAQNKTFLEVVVFYPYIVYNFKLCCANKWEAENKTVSCLESETGCLSSLNKLKKKKIKKNSRKLG